MFFFLSISQQEGFVRKTNESLEEKKKRKMAVKEEKRERRMEKKNTKELFKAERAKHLNAGI